MGKQLFFRRVKFAKRGLLPVMLMLSTVFSSSLYAQYSTSHTHTVVRSAKISGIKTASAMSSAGKSDVSTTIQYFDRFGRPIQITQQERSPQGKDMVSFMTYDSYGRQTRHYMPYTTGASNGLYIPINTAIANQASFYSNAATSIPTDPKPWSEVEYERSALKRILRSSDIGEDFQLNTGKEMFYEYSLNSSIDQVMRWEITALGQLKLAENEYHAANTLGLSITKAPDWSSGNLHTVETFTDHLGRKVLTRRYMASGTLDTYYVYDELGNLRFLIPPEAVAHMEQSNAVNIEDSRIFHTSQTFPSAWAKTRDYYYMPGVQVTLDPTMEFTTGFSIEPYPMDAELVENWIYSFEYDQFNHMVSQKSPGAAPIHYVRDKSGRLIMSQDGEQRKTNKWTFVKYDREDRPVLTGVVTDSRDKDQLSTHVKSVVNHLTNKWYEVRGSAVHGYTNNVFPNVSNPDDYLVVSYYDDYDFKSSWGSGYNFQTNSVNSDSYISFPQGLETGGKTRLIGENTWMQSVQYYDDEYQLIQGVGQNHLGYLERFYTKYNYMGQIEHNRLEQQVETDKVVTIDETYDFDDFQRLTHHWHSVDDEPQVLLASYVYNESGENKDTQLFSTDQGANYMQSIDYRYNVRGLLTSINNISFTNDGALNDDTNDLFGMQLYYNESPNDISFTPRFNGNLTGVVWRNAAMTGNTGRSYGYEYDELNQLKKASYAEKNGSNWNSKTGHYDVEGVTYDKNGNIQTLKRKESVSNTATTIDDLTYTYEGNQLKAVNDVSDANKGFKDGAELTTEYTYDDNGNAITDANKLITSITYNILDLPEVVTFSSGDQIKYVYDANKTKVRREVIISGQVSNTLDYLGGLILEDGVLSEVAHSEGRLRVDRFGDDYTYDYQFFLKDHIGNNRVMVAPLERKYVVTSESDRAVQEEAQFVNVAETRAQDGFNHTPTGNKASRLNTNQFVNGQRRMVGPAKGIKVYPNDQVSMSVYARYDDSNITSTGLTGSFLASALTSAFGVTAGNSETSQVFNALNAATSSSMLINQSTTETPAAYLNYLFFDVNYNLVTSGTGYQGISSAAKTGWENLTGTVTLDREGYLFVYVSNESNLNVNVYFDDLEVTHTSNASVLQTDELYPFGMPMANSTLTAGITANRFIYQNKEWQTELGLNLYDFHARQFDPSLGRWLAQDPQNQFGSPYLGMGNLPTMGVDPDGEIFWVAAGLALFNAVRAGINANNNDQGFWGGFGKSVAFSALSFAVSAGIGQIFGGVGATAISGSKALGEAARAGLHGLASGGIGVLGGGDFWSNAAAGALGSAVGSGFHSAKPAWQIGSSTLAGGLGAEITGGNFWDGAIQSGLTVTANHLHHRNIDRKVENELKDYDPSVHPGKINLKDASKLERAIHLLKGLRHHMHTNTSIDLTKLFDCISTTCLGGGGTHVTSQSTGSVVNSFLGPTSGESLISVDFGDRIIDLYYEIPIHGPKKGLKVIPYHKYDDRFVNDDKRWRITWGKGGITLNTSEKHAEFLRDWVKDN